MVSLKYRRHSAISEGRLRQLVVSVSDKLGPPGVALGFLVVAIAGWPVLAGFMLPEQRTWEQGLVAGHPGPEQIASYAPYLATGPTISAVPAAGNS